MPPTQTTFIFSVFTFPNGCGGSPCEEVGEWTRSARPPRSTRVSVPVLGNRAPGPVPGTRTCLLPGFHVSPRRHVRDGRSTYWTVFEYFFNAVARSHVLFRVQVLRQKKALASERIRTVGEKGAESQSTPDRSGVHCWARGCGESGVADF